ncbi:hypothetical protein XV43_002701 [Salmonella enterica subsp. enterica]|nr:hypothetical protein [Salmonella enterica subsp. enterica]EEA8717261.1 hypothetical protein [Salmonella enterica subsp. enterica serovar Lexington]
MLSKTGFTHSDLLCWQIDYAGGSLNVNGTIMRDTYITTDSSVCDQRGQASRAGFINKARSG